MEDQATEALTFLHLPASPDGALAALSEPVATWFRNRYVTPTRVQRLAWPALLKGEHLLVSAPTGSGKTLAAFVPVFDRLLRERTSDLRCLYIAPLKALVRDIAKNLRHAWQDIQADFQLRLGTRTGDTAAATRRRMFETPPHVLLTTPESLAVLLSQPQGRTLLATVRTVVVDELHALAATKRGTDLALCLERLEEALPVGAALQRIGISATVTPLDEAARFLVGTGRSCSVAAVGDASVMDLDLEPLPYPGEDGLPRGYFARLLHRLDGELCRHRTTLIFATIRSNAERLAWLLARRHPHKADAIEVHHSSLSAGRRREIEQRLKRGELWAVVSSTSLELGIDIGSIDSVVMINPPGAATKLVQRLGRSGHVPDALRRGLVLAAHPAELIENVVTASAGRAGQLEPLRVPQQPLDVLCQHLVGMAMSESWTPERAFEVLRRAHPYRDLPWRDFDACLRYLSGQKTTGEPWLPPRLRWHEGRFAIFAEPIARLLRRNLGTILAEEARPIRLVVEENGEQRTLNLGGLDDFYADRLQPGDRFLLDGRCLEYRRREGRNLVVDEIAGYPLAPKWASGSWGRPEELVRQMYDFRVQAADVLHDGIEALEAWLRDEHGLRDRAARTLTEHLLLQETISEVPDGGVLLVEGVARDLGVEYAVHTPLPRAGNEALARVITHRLEREGSWRIATHAADLGLLAWVEGRGAIQADAWRSLLSPAFWEEDLHAALAGSHLLRERFAKTALTGLMLLRQPLGGKRKVGGQHWAERRLFEQVRDGDPSFVLMRQAQREVTETTCLAEAARRFVEQLSRLTVRVRWLADMSPFASGWLETAEAQRSDYPAAV
jgi:ATP-dependent helicase Lhr and Lhr-like helicase